MMCYVEAGIAILGRFWRRYPALLYGLATLLGCFMALSWHPILLVPIVCLWFPLFFPRFHRVESLNLRLLMAFLFFLSMSLYVRTSVHFPSLSEDGIRGTAHITIDSITSSKHHFGQSWIYQGKIRSFLPEGTQAPVARNIPYRITIPQKGNIPRPPGNREYLIQGLLKESKGRRYLLTFNAKEEWRAVKESWSLAEWRFGAKSWLKAYIHRHISHQRAANFLSGIATGDFNDSLLLFEFSRFGLQHIMAISGFHFAIIAAILHFFLRLWLGPKEAAAVLIFFLSSYFLFLGFSSSVMRAWLAISIALGGQLVERKSFALNSLGFSMLCLLLIDPLLCQNLGFQFSFLATAAILMFYAFFDFLLQTTWKKRLLSQMIEMNRLNQHGYLLLNTFREALALTTAIHLVTLPVTLLLFHKFPWMSLAYNLFFPFMVSVSMLFLLVALLCFFFLSPLTYLFHAVNSAYTDFMLNFVFNMPPAVDFYLRIENLSTSFVVIYLTAIFFLGIFLLHVLERRRESAQDFLFL